MSELDEQRNYKVINAGNHFIELCLDEEERVWVMLHAGSRGVGNRIGSYFIELAKEDMRRWFINLLDEISPTCPRGRSTSRIMSRRSPGRRTTRRSIAG